MPVQDQLQLNQTFEAQRNLVTGTITPAVMEALDETTFNISEGVVYELIHNRHKHQREEYLKKQHSTKYQDEQNRRKHLNSRRNDVSNEPVLFVLFVILTIFIMF